MQVPLSLDSDGFLRRECPGCLRQFKCFYGRHPDAPDTYVEPDAARRARTAGTPPALTLGGRQSRPTTCPAPPCKVQCPRLTGR
jgi:hypothetical protein